MKLTDLPLNPSPRTLRQFAGMWILFFGALGGWELWFRNRQAVSLSLIALALTIGPLGVWRPRLMRPIYVGWLMAAFPLGWLVSHVCLALVYYLVVTPLAIASRLLGRDRLSLRRGTKERSNWSPLDQSMDVRRYFRQF